VFPMRIHFYLAVIRPILEYATPVWHHLLSKCQTDQIEAIQKRALNIIFTSTYGMPYSSALFLGGLTSLTAHREQLDWCATFFDSTVQQRSCLHHLVTATSTRSCTSVTLKSSFKISSYS